MTEIEAARIFEQELIQEKNRTIIFEQSIIKAKAVTKKTKTSLITAIVLGILGLTITASITVFYYHSFSSEYSKNITLQNRNNNLQTQIDSLQQSFDNLESEYYTSLSNSSTIQNSYDNLQRNYTDLQTKINTIQQDIINSITITSLQCGNTDNYSRWLTQAGNTLYSSQMRYLSPVITYNANFSGIIIFFIKIIEPDGTIKRNSSVSPSGYSLKSEEEVQYGNNQILNLTGWGNNNFSTYSAGVWTVEIWYRDIVCLRTEKITIY